MNHYEPTDFEATDLEPRTERALTECMTVLPDAPDLFTVVGENGNESDTVDARAGVCSCKDFEYREPAGGCEHLRRVAFATGGETIRASVAGVVVSTPEDDHGVVRECQAVVLAVEIGHKWLVSGPLYPEVSQSVPSPGSAANSFG
jgi:hypothetical protein